MKSEIAKEKNNNKCEKGFALISTKLKQEPKKLQHGLNHHEMTPPHLTLRWTNPRSCKYFNAWFRALAIDEPMIMQNGCFHKSCDTEHINSAQNDPEKPLIFSFILLFYYFFTSKSKLYSSPYFRCKIDHLNGGVYDAIHIFKKNIHGEVKLGHFGGQILTKRHTNSLAKEFISFGWPSKPDTH